MPLSVTDVSAVCTHFPTLSVLATMAYEEEVKRHLGRDIYETCLEYCDSDKLTDENVDEIALCLDPRIKAALKHHTSQKERNTRDRFRFVMSEWYRDAAGDQSQSQFNVETLIEMLKDQNVRQFPLARQLSQLKDSKENKVSTPASEEENNKEEKKVDEQRKEATRNSSLNQDRVNDEITNDDKGRNARQKLENSSTRSRRDSCRDSSYSSSAAS